MDREYEAFDQHQASAPRLGFAEEARTILDVARSVLAHELIMWRACWLSYSLLVQALPSLHEVDLVLSHLQATCPQKRLHSASPSTKATSKLCFDSCHVCAGPALCLQWLQTDQLQAFPQVQSWSMQQTSRGGPSS